MVQTLDELRRRKACGDLGGSGQSQDRERDPGLPTRGREFISGRAEGRILPRGTDQERHVQEGERPAEGRPTPLAPRRRWQQPVHTPIGGKDAIDPGPIPRRHLRSLVQWVGISQCHREQDANAGPRQCDYPGRSVRLLLAEDHARRRDGSLAGPAFGHRLPHRLPSRNARCSSRALRATSLPAPDRLRRSRGACVEGVLDARAVHCAQTTAPGPLSNAPSPTTAIRSKSARERR